MLRDGASLLGWAFLPHYATKFALETYYGIAYRTRSRPQPGTQQFLTHYRRTHAALVLGYLLLTIYDAYNQIRQQGDFYQALGIGYDATERQIKTKFRRLAAQFHPDKQTATSHAAASENVFLALKIAQDTLLNPVKRFAYDRFGPLMLSWENCATIKEYLQTGFQVYLPSYVGAAIMMLALSAMGYLDWGKFWRYLGGGVIILLEIYTLTRPEFPGFLTSVINPILSFIPFGKTLLPFQMLELARKIAFAASIAISQLGPSSRNERSGYNEIDEQRLAKLEYLAMSNDMGATRLLRMQMAPFNGDRKALDSLKTGMTKWLHQNTIRADPFVREAIAKVAEAQTVQDERENEAVGNDARNDDLHTHGSVPQQADGEPPLQEATIDNAI